MSDLKLSENTFDLTPKSLEQAMQYSELIAGSNIVPKDFKNKPGDILIAIQMGNELGLKPLQSLQNIAVINGRPTMWGDSVIALVRGSSKCEWIKETFDSQNMTATCVAKRVGGDPETRTFSMDDATQAGLANKQGPWKQYPKRMLQLRARAFAVRDVFADVISGLAIREEVQDYQNKPIHRGPVERVVDPGVSATDNLLNRLVPPERTPTEPATPAPLPDDADDLCRAAHAIGDAQTSDELKTIANPLCQKLTGKEQDIARQMYVDKKNELNQTGVIET